MKKSSKNEFCDEQLKDYGALSVKEKLKRLESMRNFFDRFMPAKSKRIWQQLQQKGF